MRWASSDSDSNGTTRQRYALLREATVYFEDQFEYDIPAFVTQTQEPTEATLVVLDQPTSTSGEQVVDWLRSNIPLAFIGESDRFFELLERGNVESYFEGEVLSASNDMDIVALEPQPEESRLIPTYVQTTDGSNTWLVGINDVLQSLKGAN